MFLIRSTVSGVFLHIFSHWQRLFLASTMVANFDGMYFTWDFTCCIMLRKAINFLCGYLSLRGVVFSLLLEINKYGICSLFTGKYNFGVVPEWGICTLFLNPTVGFLYERTAPTSGIIVCYPITDTSRFWMCQTICWMVLCQAFLSLLRLPPPPSKISSTLVP